MIEHSHILTPPTKLHHTKPFSIAGHVFDVSKGAEFYAPGQGYDFFTFRYVLFSPWMDG